MRIAAAGMAVITALAVLPARFLTPAAGLPSPAGRAGESASLAQVRKLADEHSFQQALELADRILAGNPASYGGHMARAGVLEAMGLTDQALDEYRRATELSPRSAEPHVELSRIYLSRLDFDSAIGAARRAVALSPLCLPCRLALVTALVSAEKTGEASTLLGPLQRDRPRDPDVLYLEYRLARAGGDMTAARRYLDQAIQSTNPPLAWLTESARLSEALGRFDEAIAKFQRVLERDPGSIEVNLRIASNLEFFKNDCNKALVYYRRVLDIDDASVAALAGIDRCTTKNNDLAGELKRCLRAALSRQSRENP